MDYEEMIMQSMRCSTYISQSVVSNREWCPDIAAMAAYIDKKCSVSEREFMENHFAMCRICRREVQDIRNIIKMADKLDHLDDAGKIVDKIVDTLKGNVGFPQQ